MSPPQLLKVVVSIAMGIGLVAALRGRRSSIPIPSVTHPTQSDASAKRESKPNTLSVILGTSGALALVGTLATQLVTIRNEDANRIAERYNHAIVQMSEPTALERITGIYELRNVAQGSDTYQLVGTEILADYLRVVASWSGDAATPAPTLTIETEAILSALGQLNVRRNDQGARCPDFEEPSWVNLWNTDLRGIMLFGVDLSGADLTLAHLEDATLSHATLTCARMESAQLDRANLYYANLSGALLVRTDLTDANLGCAELKGTILTGANLSGADLRTARNLADAQVRSAITDSETKLPKDFEGLVSCFTESDVRTRTASR